MRCTDLVVSFDYLYAFRAKGAPVAVSVDVVVHAAAAELVVVVAVADFECSIELDIVEPTQECDWKGCLLPYRQISGVP